MASNDAIALGEPGHGSGSVAAQTAAAAAALAERVARGSGDAWPEHHAAATQAGSLRLAAESLVQENTAAYATAVEILAEPEDNLTLGVALGRTLLVLGAIASTAADIAELCAHAAEAGDPDLRADAAGGALLAAAAAATAAHLVTINLTTRADDAAQARVDGDAERAAGAAERAVAASRG